MFMPSILGRSRELRTSFGNLRAASATAVAAGATALATGATDLATDASVFAASATHSFRNGHRRLCNCTYW